MRPVRRLISASPAAASIGAGGLVGRRAPGLLGPAAAAREIGVRTPNVYPPLRALEAADFLTSKKEHRLGPFWQSDEILTAVNAFAERAGRWEAT